MTHSFPTRRSSGLNGGIDQLTLAPFVSPLLAGTLMVLIGEQRRTLKAALGVTSAFGLVAVAILLLVLADGAPAGADAAAVRVYRLGNWPADRKSTRLNSSH